MIKWIFFDIDDTLYDQCQPFARAFQEIFPDRKDMDTEALYRRNCVYTEKVFEQIQAGIITPEESVNYRLIHAMADYGQEIDPTDAERFRICYYDHLYHISLSDELYAMLEECSAKTGLGIITNGTTDHQRRKIDSLGLARWIRPEHMIISGEADCCKPEKEIFILAQERTGASPDEMLYVGDNYDRDIAGALGADWKCVWMNRRERPVPAGGNPPDAEVHTEAELRDCLIRIADGISVL